MLCALVGATFSYAGPFFLQKILFFVENYDTESNIFIALSYCLAIFICTMIRSFADGQTYFMGRRIGLRVRSVIISLVYQKSLKRIKAKSDIEIDSNKNSPANPGMIVNLMSVGIEIYCITFIVSTGHRCC